ncbi:MAG: GxxExxY protein [Bryobacteraceae bacterium]|nr:GxxExxY protein [Bryobacteraceae bacterium]
MIYGEITHEIIRAAILVHRELGPGEEEAAYEEALCFALETRGVKFQSQRAVPVIYKGCKLDCGYRMDVLVAGQVVVEAKTLDTLAPVHEAQLLTYLKLDGRKVGLLINFRSAVLRDGLVRRVMETARNHKSSPVSQPTPPDQEDGDLSGTIIAAAMEVHRELGPGLLRSTYAECLCHELSLRELKFLRDVAVPLKFLGKTLGRAGHIGLVVAGFPVQVLAVDEVIEIHKQHLAALLRHSGKSSGLLLNFNKALLKDGIHRCFSSPRPSSSAVQP